MKRRSQIYPPGKAPRWTREEIACWELKAICASPGFSDAVKEQLKRPATSMGFPSSNGKPSPGRGRKMRFWESATTLRWLRLLDKLSDAEIAWLTRRTVESVRVRRTGHNISKADSKVDYWTPDEDALVGTAPDESVARKLGRSTVSVQKRRLRLGIAYSFSKHRYWTDEEIALLEKLPDAEVARLIDRRDHEVGLKRRFFEYSDA